MASKEPFDFLAQHNSDGDMWDMLEKLEEEVLKEEGDEEGLAILEEERKAIEEGKEDEYYAGLKAEGVDI